MESIWPRIWFDSSRGCGIARTQFVTVRLSGPPTIAANLECIDFAPSLDTAEIQQRGDRKRDMTPSERAAARSLLDQLEDAVRPLFWTEGHR